MFTVIEKAAWKHFDNETDLLDFCSMNEHPCSLLIFLDYEEFTQFFYWSHGRFEPPRNSWPAAIQASRTMNRMLERRVQL